LRGVAATPTSALALDAIVFLLASLRFVVGERLPFSGHTLFLTYAGVTASIARYRWVALALFIGTTGVKLWVWRDPFSWAAGILLGLAAGALTAVVQRQHSSRLS
jgi:hypothetical protein